MKSNAASLNIYASKQFQNRTRHYTADFAQRKLYTLMQNSNRSMEKTVNNMIEKNIQLEKHSIDMTTESINQHCVLKQLPTAQSKMLLPLGQPWDIYQKANELTSLIIFRKTIMCNSRSHILR